MATSYASNVTDVNMPGFIPFTTKAMVDEAKKLGMKVEPWTPNRLNLIEYLVKDCESSCLCHCLRRAAPGPRPPSLRTSADTTPCPNNTGGVTGIITDWPAVVHDWLVSEGYSVPPLPGKKEIKRIDKCLEKHLVLTKH